MPRSETVLLRTRKANRLPDAPRSTQKREPTHFSRPKSTGSPKRERDIRPSPLQKEALFPLAETPVLMYTTPQSLHSSQAGRDLFPARLGVSPKKTFGCSGSTKGTCCPHRLRRRTTIPLRYIREWCDGEGGGDNGLNVTQSKRKRRPPLLGGYQPKPDPILPQIASRSEPNLPDTSPNDPQNPLDTYTRLNVT